MRACGPARLIIARSPALSIQNPLVITIEDASGARRLQALAEAAKHSWKLEFVHSIDKTSPQVSELYAPSLNYKKRKHPMTAGEIACYYGHRKAWNIVACEKMPYRLILEDDFRVAHADLLPSLEGALSKIQDWDIICLSPFRPKRPFKTLFSDKVEVRQHLFGATGAVGYLISRSGATKLLTRSKIFRPLDEDFICPWELNLSVLYTAPGIIEEAPDSISTLESARVEKKKNPLSSFRGAWLKLDWQTRSIFNWIMH